MGEQDVLPSTQDAQVGSDVAEATLPEVVIAPQVSSGKVIDALRQFLPREVMVEVIARVGGGGASVAVEVVDERGAGVDAGGEIDVAVELVDVDVDVAVDHVADDVFAAVHAVEDDVVIAIDTGADAHVAPDAQGAPYEAACEHVDNEIPQRDVHVVVDAESVQHVQTCPAVDADAIHCEAGCVTVEADAQQHEENEENEETEEPRVTADVVAVPVADDLPRIITPSAEVARYGGALPASLMESPPVVFAVQTPRRRSLLRRLSRWLVPDAVGRWMQHPVLSILAGVAFGLLVLWWVLGD